jgi:hypothetical protein
MASRFIAPTPGPPPALPPVSAAVKEDLRPHRRVNRGLRTTVKTGLTGVLERPAPTAAGVIPARKLLLGE